MRIVEASRDLDGMILWLDGQPYGGSTQLVAVFIESVVTRMLEG